MGVFAIWVSSTFSIGLHVTDSQLNSLERERQVVTTSESRKEWEMWPKLMQIGEQKNDGFGFLLTLQWPNLPAMNFVIQLPVLRIRWPSLLSLSLTHQWLCPRLLVETHHLKTLDCNKKNIFQINQNVISNHEHRLIKISNHEHWLIKILKAVAACLLIVTEQTHINRQESWTIIQMLSIILQ